MHRRHVSRIILIYTCLLLYVLLVNFELLTFSLSDFMLDKCPEEPVSMVYVGSANTWESLHGSQWPPLSMAGAFQSHGRTQFHMLSVPRVSRETDMGGNPLRRWNSVALFCFLPWSSPKRAEFQHRMQRMCRNSERGQLEGSFPNSRTGEFPPLCDRQHSMPLISKYAKLEIKVTGKTGLQKEEWRWGRRF